MYVLTMAGRFTEAFQLGTELLQSGGDQRPGAGLISYALAGLEALRGNVDAAREHLVACHGWAESDDIQQRGNYAAAEAAVFLAEQDNRHALDVARRVVDEATTGGLGVSHESVRLAFPVAVEAAIDAGDLEEADRLVELLAMRPRGEVPPFLRAQVTRAKALVAAARGDDAALEEILVAAEGALRELGYPYWTARAQLDRAEWLARQSRLEESMRLASQAAASFEKVGAAPMLARARALFEPETVRDRVADGERAVAQSRSSVSE
jgi:hypothetical protein